MNLPRAIVVRDLVKEFPTESGPKRVLDGISFRVEPGERLAILGRNGAGKSTLIKLLAGLQRPTSGVIERGLAMSWPLALGGGFEGEMTGYDNVRFIARLYRAPFDAVMDYVADFTELGRDLHEPLRLYSDGMRMRLAFALSLAQASLGVATLLAFVPIGLALAHQAFALLLLGAAVAHAQATSLERAGR